MVLKIFHSKPSQSLKRSLVSRASVSVGIIVIYLLFRSFHCSCISHDMIMYFFFFFYLCFFVSLVESKNLLDLGIV